MGSPSRDSSRKGAEAGKANVPFLACPGPIGLRARELLVDRGCAGQVLAAVSGAVYLQADGGQILWLTPPARGGVEGFYHARAVVCTCDEPALGAGMAFGAQSGILRLGNQSALDLRQAAVWSPRLVSVEDAAARKAAVGRATRVSRALAPLGNGESRPAGFDAAAEGIARACAAHDLLLALRLCRELVGLGPGMTPAGDDFVGGLLFTAWHLRQAYPIYVPWDGPAVENLLSWAGTATTAISSCILGDLAAGDGPAPLHDLLCALLAGDDDGSTVKHALRVRQLGSSTGQAMLEGASTGMLLLSDPVG